LGGEDETQLACKGSGEHRNKRGDAALRPANSMVKSKILPGNRKDQNLRSQTPAWASTLPHGIELNRRSQEKTSQIPAV